MKSPVSIPLTHFNERPEGIEIDTLVIHSMYAPQSTDQYSVTECIHLLDAHEVAAHYIIGRDGSLYACVVEDRRAWHAGESKMPFLDDSRTQVNDFSIGVELIGSDVIGFTDEQYETLCELTLDIALRHPLRVIVGHDQIAPHRKVDPGSRFDWSKYSRMVGIQRFKFLQL